MGLDAVVPTLLIVIARRHQDLGVSESLAEFQRQKIQRLKHKSAIVFAIVVVSDGRIVSREVVRQKIAGHHDEGWMRQGRAHLVQRRAQEPPIRILAVLAEASELGSLQDRLPLRGIGCDKIADQG